ncbi:cell division cycle and apoptosis regulator protein 1-like [Musca vetustissima]|uniref:cell division cycle and apoptosis regulator protein 1-like n=1 Tax=Musca vetustissima TaxID=27455 RepID=UPI002AB776B3|nr:cell division cycle and apoptosis regulator protein 1-like [Musca vetustissima]
MSFGGQSNAWQRNMMQQGHPQSNSFPQYGGFQNNMASGFHGGGGGGGVGGGGNMYPNAGGDGGVGGGGGGSVQYPIRTGLNPVAFQGSGVGGGGGGGMPPQNRHYNSIGTVTKISNDCGLVNNEVFFYRNVCKGPEPKLGDRVIFEASYSTSGQFKWNATQIQLMPSKPPMMNQMDANYGSPGPMSNDYPRGGGGGGGVQMQRHPSPKRSALSPIRHDRDRRGGDRDRHRRSWDRDDDDHDRKRRREDREQRSRDRNNSLNRGAGGAAAGGATRDRERDRDYRRNDRSDRDQHRERERDRDRADRPERGDRVERERERDRDKEKEREKPRDAAVEKNQSVVPKGGRNRAIRRYMIQIPKHLLALKYADIQTLRNRYSSLYIPSDFFHANIKWTETFTPDNPFSLRRPCQFHLMDKNAESPFEQPSQDELEPADADYVYSAKVMLLSLPPIAEIYRKCFENNNKDDADHQQPGHLSRLINFLVGLKGSKEPMAIGGPWSPSLDGENPDTDPSVLIRTAIRTCKALTNIDLSNCTQWYRFMELYYHRSEYKNMEKGGPPRVETVVIFLPDIHSCMPSIAEYNTMVGLYKATAEKIISRRAAATTKAIASKAANADNEGAATKPSDDNNADGDEENAQPGEEENMQGGDEGDGDDGENNAVVEGEEQEAEGENADADQDEQMDNSGVDAADGEPDESTTHQDNDGDDDDDMGHQEDHVPDAEAADENCAAYILQEEPTPEPTHYSLLDLKNMKVQEIRDELLARDLSDKGVRNVVMARLAKALNTEKREEIKAKNREKHQQKMGGSNKKAANDTAAAEAADEDVNAKLDDSTKDWADAIDFEMSDIVILDEYDANKNNEDKAMSRREKAKLLRRYTLPSTPQIVVHPNKLAKGGSFDCALMSLQVLMDYHHADTKERIFELSLFAELFNEMLMRDFAFNIYKEIHIYNSKDHSAAEDNNEAGTAAAGGEESKSADGEENSEGAKSTADNNGGEKSSDDGKSGSSSRKRRTSTKDPQDSEKASEKPPPKRRMSTIDGRELAIASGATDDQHKKRHGSTVDGRDADDSKSTDSNKKVVVAKPLLLLSFLYFDSTHCGYIFERDLEDLFMVLGLNLSRSQIKKVLSKIGTRSLVHYRKLTDKKESADALAKIEDADDLDLEELKDIAAGNNKYEFVFGETQHSNYAIPIEGDGNESDLVHYNGAVIHVGKLMEQIKRTEKELSDMEKLYNDLVKEHSDLQKEQSKAKSKIKDLSDDTKSLRRKLTDTNQELYTLTRKYRDQNSTLLYIYTRVEPYFSKDKDKDSKNESSHKDDKDSEKDKHRGDKHSDKDHSKEKSKESEKDKTKDRDHHDKEKSSNVIKSEKDKEKSKECEKEKEKEKPVKVEKVEAMETDNNTSEETKEAPAAAVTIKKEEEKKEATEKPSEEKKENKEQATPAAETPAKETKPETKKTEETAVKVAAETPKKSEEEKKEATSVTTKAAATTKPAQTNGAKPAAAGSKPAAGATTANKATTAAKATPAKNVATKTAGGATPAKVNKPAAGTPAKPAAGTAAKPATGTPAKLAAGTPAKPAAGKPAATPAKPAAAGAAGKATSAKANPNVKKPAGTANKKPNTDNSQK